MVMFYIFFVCLPREYSIIPWHSRDIPMIFQGYSVTWSVKIPVKKFRSLSRGQVLTFNTGMVAFSKQSLWEEAVPSFVKCQKRDRFVDRTSTFFLWRMMGFYRTCSTLFFFMENDGTYTVCFFWIYDELVWVYMILWDVAVISIIEFNEVFSGDYSWGVHSMV